MPKKREKILALQQLYVYKQNVHVKCTAKKMKNYKHDITTALIMTTICT